MTKKKKVRRGAESPCVMHVQSVSVASMAKLQGILMLVFGFILALFGYLAEPYYGYGLVSVFGQVGFMGVFMLALAYGVLGVICGALAAAIYNLAARFLGGIELRFDKN